MKKLTLALILILLCALSLGVLPAYATQVGTEDSANNLPLIEGDTDDPAFSHLTFCNFILPSGEVLHQYVLTPRPAMVSGGGGSQLLAAQYFSVIAQRLQEQLPEHEVKFFNADCTITVTKKYESLTALSIANGDDGFEYQPFEGEQQSSFFYTSYTTRTKTIWQHVEDTTTLPGVLNTVLLTAGESAKAVRYSYVYGTKYKPRALTSDANRIVFLNGLYLHQFNMDSDSVGRQITLIQNQPNQAGWNIVVLAVGFLIAGASLMYVLIKKKKEKKQ